MKYNQTSAKKAFTLIELSVVIVIIGLIGAMGLSASRDMIDNANLAATQNRLDTIEKALFAFWQKNGRLPCPADGTLSPDDPNYGVGSDPTIFWYSSRCATGSPTPNFDAEISLYKASEGVVPVVTLGLPKDFIYDGWKRKIAYAVTSEFGVYKASERIPPKSGICVPNTAIRIKDASGADRSTSAVYALISYGKNGHGGYTATGSSRYNAGSTNADEQTNCHCTSTADDATYDGDYVQRTQNLNSQTPDNYFDDIVRYKERWQLATAEDLINDDGYRGPDLAVGFFEATTGTVYTYKNQCGAFIKQADLNPLPTNEVRGIAFTTGNKHLLVYSGAGCNLYKINGNGTLTNLPSAFSTACPYNSTAVMALSNNGYLAVSAGTSSAVVHLWKQSGDKFIALPDLIHSNASVAQVSFSLDAKLLAVRSATNTSLIYKRKGNTFSSATADISQPANLSYYNTPDSIVFSPDGNYLSDSEHIISEGFSYVQTWRILGKDFASFAPIESFTIHNTAKHLIYSSDSMGIFFADTLMYYCKISANDYFCGNKSLWNGYVSTTGIYVGEFLVGGVDYDNNYVALSRNANYAFMSNRGVSDTYLPGRTGYYYYGGVYGSKFQDDGTVGTSPVRALDQILPGGTGGPAAFAH